DRWRKTTCSQVHCLFAELITNPKYSVNLSEVLCGESITSRLTSRCLYLFRREPASRGRLWFCLNDCHVDRSRCLALRACDNACRYDARIDVIDWYNMPAFPALVRVLPSKFWADSRHKLLHLKRGTPLRVPFHQEGFGNRAKGAERRSIRRRRKALIDKRSEHLQL